MRIIFTACALVFAHAVHAGVPVQLDVEKWIKVKVPFRDFPMISERADGGWVVKTEDDAGGLAALFGPRLSSDRGALPFSWTWQVKEFPSTKPVLPPDKKNDDYAIRVGFLLSDGKNSLPVPGDVGKLLERKKLKISNVLFYVAVPGGPSSREGCGVSAYDDRIFLCYVKANGAPERVTVDVASDIARVAKLPNTRKLETPLKVVGSWIFADSDNSETRSWAKIENFEMSDDQAIQRG